MQTQKDYEHWTTKYCKKGLILGTDTIVDFEQKQSTKDLLCWDSEHFRITLYVYLSDYYSIDHVHKLFEQ